MGKKQQSRGQKRAAKVAARRKKAGRPHEPLRPVTTLPGLDEYGPADGLGQDLVEELQPVDEMRYAVAEIRTVRAVGPYDGNPEWLEVLEANVAALAEAGEDDLVVEIIDDRVRRAVADTLASSSPEPAREEVRCLVASDGETAPADLAPGEPGGAPAQALAFAVLLGWLANSGPRPIPAAARTRVPEWVRSTLGDGAAAAVDRVIGILGSDADRAEAIGPVAEELGDDYLAALMWIAAGLVALYGEGSTDYLPGVDAEG
ncbi:hypothetical protein GCM10010472_33820 [Pseudonocardia halophobica]|uniref:Uncharacterized protein n=1 Tax=Pseudonocardia halophobica TaxID=29401 RepID=A0A9W6P055_9PSEU|nr:hypothetical protein [Pseudonocardia halophobica]GLL15409.1 hypothetical protein GCM10017577_65590 [Pseudonocardia halophobica]